MSTSKDEKEIFDFLDSLPTESESKNVPSELSSKSTDATPFNTDKKKGKSDAEILDFLDELEGKTTKSRDISKEPETSTNTTNTTETNDLESSNETIKTKSDDSSIDNEQYQRQHQEEVKDPITSIASWWSNSGSNAVSSQLSSLWGTAQSIGEQAQKQAEDAIKKAREQSLEVNIRTAFKELGISGVHDNINEMLTEEQKAELMKLPVTDAKKALESLNSGLNSGLSFVGGTLNEVIERINAFNNKDEIIEIVVVHDMKNFIGLSNMIKLNFEDVMTQQVDGRIEVNVYESGTARSTKSINDGDYTSEDRIDFALFNGKGSDAEKLTIANIDNEKKQRIHKEDPVNEPSTTDSSSTESSPDMSLLPEAKKTTIYISLLAWTSNKDNSNSSIGKDITIDSHSTSSFTISCMLKDDLHGISISSQSQPMPLKWAHWVEGNFEEGEKEDDIDPSEWVIGWIKNAVSNVIGVTSQSYVIKRMGY